MLGITPRLVARKTAYNDRIAAERFALLKNAVEPTVNDPSWVYCRKKGGYTIDASQARARGDGTRRFCTDESGTVGCRLEWNRSRHQRLPCPK